MRPAASPDAARWRRCWRDSTATSIHVDLWRGRRLAGAGRAGCRDLLLARRRPRARHRHRDRRSFIQLTPVGYAIKLIFDADTISLVLALLAAMVLFGALTARHRAERSPTPSGRSDRPRSRRPHNARLVVALGIFEPTARYLVPVGGMVIGNAMTASAVALNGPVTRCTTRGPDQGDAGARRDRQGEAAAPTVRRALRWGRSPSFTHPATGLIFFPGTMVGMLLAGATRPTPSACSSSSSTPCSAASRSPRSSPPGSRIAISSPPAQQLREPDEPTPASA